MASAELLLLPLCLCWLLIAVTSRPPSLSISSLRFFIGGIIEGVEIDRTTGTDIGGWVIAFEWIECDGCGIDELSLSLSTKSITSNEGFIVSLMKKGVIVVGAGK